MSLAGVYTTIQTAIVNAINTAGIANKGQVVVGWPVATELVKILGQTDNEYVVSIYQATSKKATRYIEDPQQLSAPSTGLTATYTADTGNTITFTGTTTGTANVHTYLLGYTQDAYASIATGTAPAATATAVAAAINALAISGVSASASTNVVTVTGAAVHRCNIGGTGILAQEVARVESTMWVTIWTTLGPTGIPLGDAISDAIKQRVGTVGTHRYALPDTSTLYLAYDFDVFDDNSQSSYSAYQFRMIFDAEYGIVAQNSATQVEAFKTTATVNTMPASSPVVIQPLLAPVSPASVLQPRYVTLQMSSADFTPSATGIDYGGLKVVPTVNDAPASWTVLDYFFRVETAGSTPTTVRVQRSTTAGVFINSGYLDSGGCTIAANQNEAPVPVALSITTVNSGDKLMCEYTALGTGAQHFTFQVLLRQQ